MPFTKLAKGQAASTRSRGTWCVIESSSPFSRARPPGRHSRTFSNPDPKSMEQTGAHNSFAGRQVSEAAAAAASAAVAAGDEVAAQHPTTSKPMHGRFSLPRRALAPTRNSRWLGFSSVGPAGIFPLAPNTRSATPCLLVQVYITDVGYLTWHQKLLVHSVPTYEGHFCGYGGTFWAQGRLVSLRTARTTRFMSTF